jgi:hypothetical protein
VSFQNLPRELDIQAAPFLARLTSVVAGTGAQAGLNLYGFAEANFDPTTGFPLDANPGRADNLQTVATTYAVEIDNNLVPGLTSTPQVFTPLTATVASPFPYPYAWLRQKGMVNNGVIYEFAFPPPAKPLAWVKVTSTTSSSVTLPGGSITGYPAVIVNQAADGTLSNGATVWYHELNNQVPTLNQIYQARFFENSTTGAVPVWETAFPPPGKPNTPVVVFLGGDVGLSPSTATNILSYTVPAGQGGTYTVWCHVSGLVTMVSQSVVGDTGTLTAWLDINGSVPAPVANTTSVPGCWVCGYVQQVISVTGSVVGTGAMTGKFNLSVGDVVNLNAKFVNTFSNASGTISGDGGTASDPGLNHNCGTTMVLQLFS